MYNNDFKYPSTQANFDCVNNFQGSEKEREIVREMIKEWNERVCVSELCSKWVKERPVNKLENLLFVLYNFECLNTHLSDIDIILNTYTPQIIILTGVGLLVHNLPYIPQYYWQSQKGTNSFGGVAFLVHNSIKSKVIDNQDNFLLIEIQVTQIDLRIGAVYVPPKSMPPFQLFEICKDKEFFISGDFNAKHTSWSCKSNNASGIEIKQWLEETGYEGIFPHSATSKRSDAVIDFALGYSAKGWKTMVVNIGTSDHFPVLFLSPFVTEKNV
jgi:hypothetical protein